MKPWRSFLLAAAIVCLAGCAKPPAPEPQRHQCHVIPTGMVECWLVDPEAE